MDLQWILLSHSKDHLGGDHWNMLLCGGNSGTKYFFYSSYVLECHISQLIACLDKLYSSRVRTQTKIMIYDNVDYPALTFCFKDGDWSGYDIRMLNVRIISHNQMG